MFGQTTLFSNLSDELGPDSYRGAPLPQENGGQEDEVRRRNYLMAERNELLAHRYYFYDCLKFYKSEKCLQELEREFFISERRLIDIIYTAINTRINELRAKKPAPKELAQKYPWMNWSI